MEEEKKEKFKPIIIMDFETGGLDCQNCAATQLSLHAIRLDTLEQVGSRQYYFKPYIRQEELGKPIRKTIKTKYEIEDEEEAKEETLIYDKDALAVSGITMDILNSQGMELKEACEDMVTFFKSVKNSIGANYKPILAGQNVRFDIGFLQQIMSYTDTYKKIYTVLEGDVDFFGNFQPAYIDTLTLAQLAFMHNKQVTTYRLEALAERLGIDMDDAHDADADVTATQDVLRTFIMRLRNAGGAVPASTEQNKEKMRDHFKI